MVSHPSYETLSEGEDRMVVDEVDSLPDLEPDPLQDQVLPLNETIDNDEKECWVCFLSESETPDSGISAKPNKHAACHLIRNIGLDHGCI